MTPFFFLERHLNAVKDTYPDPQRLLASVEVIEKATKQQIENLEKEKQAALEQYSTEKQQREYIEKLYSQANSITYSDSSILQIVSHEAASRLVAIRGIANRIKTRANSFADSPAKLSMYMDDIEVSAYELLILFTGIPNIFGQDAKINLQPTKIYEGILKRLSNIIETSSKKIIRKSVQIKFETSNQIKPVYIDRRITEQAFYNLLMNAIKYNNPNASDVTINIVITQTSKYTEVKFQDNGLGIEEDEMDRIFMQGYRARKAIQYSMTGAGMGLTVARKAAELHGGTLELTSQSNPTEFTYSIPNIEMKDK